MPLDPNIALSIKPPAFNSPFESLGQMQALQQQRQVIQSNQALEESRRQDIEKQRKLEAAQQKFYTIIATSKTPAEVEARIRTEAPEMLAGYQKQRVELDEKAASIREKGLQASKLVAEIQAKGKEYAEPFMQLVEKSGHKPEVFDFALNTIASHFPDFPADQYRQQAGGDPAKIKAIVDSLKSPQQQNADVTATTAAAKLPGETAQAAILTQQAAHMSPEGLTPDQQRQGAQAAVSASQAASNAAAQQGFERQRIGLEQQRVGLERQRVEQAKKDSILTNPSGQTGLSAVQPGTRDDAFIAQLPTATADKVKALVDGRLQLPTRFAKGDTYWQGLLDAAVKYDPSFDAVNYNSRAKTRQDFTSGKSGATINALNTVAQHLDRLSTSADALNNSWSPAYNTVANFLSRHSGNKMVTNFETDKKAVVDELTRAWRQSGGTEADIKSWSQVLDAANSPTQLHGAIGEMSGLLEGKLQAMESQYQQGMGTDAVKAITPAARAVLTKLSQKAGGTAPVAAAPVQAAAGGPKVGETRTANGETRRWTGTEWALVK